MLQISGLPSGAYHPVKPRTKLESATLLGRSSLMGVSSTCNISTSGGYWKSNIIEKIVYLDKSVDHLITQLCMLHLQRATFTKVFVGGTTLAYWCQGLSFCAMKPKNLLTYQEVTVDGDFCGVLCRHVALVEWNSRLCMPPKCHPDTIPPLRRTWIRQQSILQFLTAPLKDNCSLSRFPNCRRFKIYIKLHADLFRSYGIYISKALLEHLLPKYGVGPLPDHISYVNSLDAFKTYFVDPS